MGSYKYAIRYDLLHVIVQGTNAKTGTNMASGKTTPLICGENDGSHIYVDAGSETTSEAVLTAVLTGTNSRKWKIKVKEILRGLNNLYL